ncbi:IS1182 family transposase [Microcoleus sp. herbarium7]|uniref:IS1182 family transposase n=1 Tax=Microcoleus sp. herbarium7 TaxID=3055435 RepID=UPI002FCF85FE
MPIITPKNRTQIELKSLEDFIEKDNTVRFIDAFVEKLELDKLRFANKIVKTEGRPSFTNQLFLKLYFYGYLNGIRSSRKLAKECARNIEMQWLCNGLTPNYHSIADFRKVNSQALRNTFKLFVSFLKDADLVMGSVIAVDGTKARAHNSKKNNYNHKKIDRHFAYIEEKTNQYLKELDEADKQEQNERVKNIEEKLEKLKTQKLKYDTLQTQLQQSNEPQVSTTDKDARALLVHGQVVEVSYNTQAAVDDKHKLVVATHTINKNDRNALSKITLEAKENLQVENFTLLADKGYNNAKEIEACQTAGITTIVAQQEIVNSNAKGTTKDYLVTNFIYNKDSDTYTCPQQQTLTTTGTWHSKQREHSSHKFKKYRTTACKTCAALKLCTAKADGRREIERSEYAEAMELNNKNYKEHYQLYRKRQEINEHIFGTIKRVWGYYYTNLKGLKKVNGEWALIMTVYNMKRTVNILGFDTLMQKLNAWKPEYKKEWLALNKINVFNCHIRTLFFEYKIAA